MEDPRRKGQNFGNMTGNNFGNNYGNMTGGHPMSRHGESFLKTKGQISISYTFNWKDKSLPQYDCMKNETTDEDNLLSIYFNVFV